MTNLLDLVDDLYLHIILYLLPQDQIKFSSINKIFVGTLAKKCRKVTIKQNLIHDFITNRSFQERLFQSIENSSNQLSIKIPHPRLKVPTPKKWQKLHPFCPKILKLNVSFVDFQNYYSYFFETIENMIIFEDRRDAKEIAVLNCFEKYQSKKIELMNLQVKVIGFFPTTLKELKIFKCSHTRFDVSTLWWQTVHQIELINCDDLLFLPDCFNFIPIVKIRACENIQDVRMLQDNQYVELNSISATVDFHDCFKNCRALNLSLPTANMNFNLYNLEKIEDFSSWVGSLDSNVIVPGRPLPPSLRKLSLSDCVNLSDLDSLQNLEELALSRIESLVSVALLGRVPVLKLIGLAQLKSLDGLGRGNKDVYIRDCPAITSFLPLQSVEKVHIYNSPLMNGNDVKYVSHLILEGCESLEDVSPLSNIRSLELIRCMQVKNYQTLKNNRSIIITFFGRSFPWTDDLKELVRQYPTHRVEGYNLYISRR